MRNLWHLKILLCQTRHHSSTNIELRFYTHSILMTWHFVKRPDKFSEYFTISMGTMID
jgi:hypothetical protein